MTHIITIQAWIARVVLILASCILAACSGPNDQQMVQTASKYLDERKVREAALELRGALQQNPGNAEARYLLGGINLDLGDFAGAEKEFLRAREAGWEESETQVGLARALIPSNRFQDLIDQIEIKETYPAAARADLYGLRAAAQAGLGDLGQARESLATGAATDASAIQLLKFTIQIQQATGEQEAAASTLAKALSLHPDNPELLLLRASMAIQDEQRADAMEACQKIIEQDPAKLITVYGRQARLGLARLEIQDGNLEQAQAALLPLLTLNADDPMANYLGGMLAFEQENYQLAEERLLKVLKVAPEHTQTLLLFGTVNYAQQDYEQAVYYLARYVNTVPENLGARKLLSRTYMLLGQHDEAQSTLQTALDEEIEDASLLALVGLSRLQMGDTVSGIEGLEQALRLDPDRTALRGELAKAYISAGQTDRAIHELETMLAEDGDQNQTKTLLVIAYLRAGDFERAIARGMDMLSRNPEDPAVLTLVGNVMNAADKKPEAREYLNKALQMKPGYVPATMSLAGIEEQDGNYTKAESLYKGIVDADTESIKPLLSLARVAEAQGKSQEMIHWLEQASERAPRDNRPRVFLAEYYLRNQQIDKSDLLVKEAINIGPRQPTLLALQVRIMMVDGRYNEALPLLNELITKEPEWEYARTLLGESYWRLGQTEDARRQLGIVLERKPYYVPALVLISGVELHSGRPKQALGYAEHIQKAQPDLYLGYQFAGDAWMASKDYAKAVVAYSRAWGLEPSADLAIRHSRALLRSGNPEEAPAVLLEWLDDHPDDATVLQSLGTIYENQGQKDKAVETYERLLVLQPDNLVALNNLAWQYSLSSNTKALELAERAYQINPESPGIQDTYGWILVQQGQVEQGRILLKQAMEKLSEVPEVRYHYAVALLKSGNKSEANKLLNQLLQSEQSFEGREDARVLLGMP